MNRILFGSIYWVGVEGERNFLARRRMRSALTQSFRDNDSAMLKDCVSFVMEVSTERIGESPPLDGEVKRR
jgi:hypothetical protein